MFILCCQLIDISLLSFIKKSKEWKIFKCNRLQCFIIISDLIPFKAHQNMLVDMKVV